MIQEQLVIHVETLEERLSKIAGALIVLLESINEEIYLPIRCIPSQQERKRRWPIAQAIHTQSPAPAGNAIGAYMWPATCMLSLLPIRRRIRR
jgi:hypothetical protein